ncbi:MAG: zinc ribbon domain-containing protein [Eubacteriales bacterium]
MEPEKCQSCGMPIEVEDLYGTEKDGQKNKDYCINCYENGEFSHPEITMEEMIDVCVPYLSQSGMDKQKARAILSKIFPQLKRWKNK